MLYDTLSYNWANATTSTITVNVTSTCLTNTIVPTAISTQTYYIGLNSTLSFTFTEWTISGSTVTCSFTYTTQVLKSSTVYYSSVSTTFSAQFILLAYLSGSGNSKTY